MTNVSPKYNSRLISAVAVLFIAIGSDLAGQGNEFTIDSVVFHPITTQGESPSFRVVELREAGGKDVANRCLGPVCSSFRMGTYDYALKLDVNGRIVRGQVRLYSHQEWVTVSLGPAIGDAGDFVGTQMNGRIMGIDVRRHEPIWVRLQMVYAPTAEEQVVDKDGEFSFDHVLPGKWILLVLQGDKVLYNQVHTLPQRERVDIRLPNSATR